MAPCRQDSTRQTRKLSAFFLCSSGPLSTVEKIAHQAPGHATIDPRFRPERALHNRMRSIGICGAFAAIGKRSNVGLARVMSFSHLAKGGQKPDLRPAPPLKSDLPQSVNPPDPLRVTFLQQRPSHLS